MLIVKPSLKIVYTSFLSCYRSLHLVRTSDFREFKVVRQSKASRFLNSITSYFETKLNLKPHFLKYITLSHYKKDMFNEDACNVFKKHVPNDAARGITTLDRSLFSCPVKVLGIAVPNNSVTQFRKNLKTSIIRIPNVKPVASLSDNDPLYNSHRLVLLDPSVYKTPEDFTSNYCHELGDVERESCKFYDLTLNYKNWNYDEILKWILPEGMEGVGGYSIIGHIAHLNLKDEVLDYKDVIGEVILDKNSCIKTVVNKLHTIDNTFRNFKMEILAGEDNLITTAREHGFSYELDFSKIYWNSRLSTEHQRIIDLVTSKDILFDVFAGVGPFSIPCAKKGCRVYANDLNEHSVYWLKKNLKVNKIREVNIDVFNLDGRDFIKTVIRPELLKLMASNANNEEKVSLQPLDQLIHIPMNLPALAIEFLDAFPGLIHEAPQPASLTSSEHCTEDDQPPTEVPLPPCENINGETKATTPSSGFSEVLQRIDRTGESNLIVHCYGFSKEVDPEKDVTQRVKDVLGLESLNLYGEGIKRVRNVAPNKEMLCVSVRLPWELLLRKPSIKREGGDLGFVEPDQKRIKI